MHACWLLLCKLVGRVASAAGCCKHDDAGIL